MGVASQAAGKPGARTRAKRWLVGALFLFLGAAGLLVSMAMGWVMPRLYESTAVIQVTAVAQHGQAMTAEEIDKVMEAEAQRVVSVPTLDRVRDRLGLLERWEMDVNEVRAALRGAVAVETEAEAGLIRIRVQRREAEEAQVLAFAVAEAYRDLRNTEELSKAEGLLKALDAELEEQEREVEEKRKALERVLEEGGLKHMEKEEQAALQQDLLQARQQLERDLHFLRELHGDSLYRHAAGLERRQNSAPLLYRELERLEESMAGLERAGYGPSHPRLVAQDVQRGLLKVELDRCVKELRRALESELARVRGRLGRVERMMAEPSGLAAAAAVAVANRAGNVPVWHAVDSARAELVRAEKILGELRTCRHRVREEAAVVPVRIGTAAEP